MKPYIICHMHIGGAFLEAGFVDEVSVLLVPGIDGHHESSPSSTV